MKYRRDIDGLRTMAVMPVVLDHADIPGFSGGYVGVDIFFVISGFLITGILARELAEGQFSIIRFYERRARRILPALVVVLLACLVVGARVLSEGLYMDLARSVAATLLFASNILFYSKTSGYFAPESDFEPLLHTWSLAVEEQFYIFFPLLLWWMFRWRSPMRLGVLLALCGGSFLLSLWATDPYPQANFYLTPTRIWELGLGAALALGVVGQSAHQGLREAASAAGLMAIIASIALYDSATPFPGLSAALPCLGAVLIIWAGAEGSTFVGRLLSQPLMVGIGLISYSLYLWHWPVLVYFRLQTGHAELALPVAGGAILLAILLATLSWRFVERPFRSPKGFSGRAIFASSGSALAVMLAVCGLILMTGGFPSRVPAPVQLIYAGAEDYHPDRRACTNRGPGEDLCPIGEANDASAPQDVLLWGDSHAGAIMPGIGAVLEAQGMQGLMAAKSGCPPLLGLSRADRGPRHQCAAFNDAVLAMLQSRDDMQLVILNARWALAAEGLRAPGEAGPPAILRTEPVDRSDLDPAGNYATFAPALGRTVRAIRATGREVLIIEGTPEFGWPVPRLLGNHHFFGATTRDIPTRSMVEARNARANTQIRALASEDAGVAAISLLPVLCPETCRLLQGGRPLYSDDDHLSMSGAIAIVPSALETVFSEGG